MNEGLDKKSLLGIGVSVVDQPKLLEGICGLVSAGKPALVNNVNIYACNLAYGNTHFRDVLNHSDIVFCDGFGVKLAGWLTGTHLGQRMTPPDWIDDLFVLCAEKGYRVYFLGDTAEVVRCFSQQVQANHPELKVAGWHHGFFDLKSAENDRVKTAIAESGSDIIITGMGMPRQELWAWEAKQHLGKGVIVATGALFRWYTGVDKRAPKWVTDCGLEWLARLLCNPVRHFKRYVIGIPLFFWRVIRFHWLKVGSGDRA